jgi:tetratricopeptide (TPR) repeat protein
MSRPSRITTPTNASGLRDDEVLRLAGALIDRTRQPPDRVPPQSVADLASALSIKEAVVGIALEALARDKITRPQGGTTLAKPAWQLDHAYLARPIMRLEGDRDRWRLLLAERARSHADSDWRHRWQTLLTLKEQAWLLGARLRGRFRYGDYRRFALKSVLRSAPALASFIVSAAFVIASFNLFHNLTNELQKMHRDPLFFVSQGADHHARGEIDRAIADYDKAIRLDPKNVAAYSGRGGAYYDKKEYDHAIADYDRAIMLGAGAYIYRGYAYSAKGDFDHAIADSGQAIMLDPKSAGAYNNRCWARMIVGQQLQQALSDCSESLRIQPNSADTLDSLGFAHLKLDQLDDAIVDFNAALEINSKLASSLYGRGLAKLKKGDSAGADGDMAAAKAIKADIAKELARYGIK